jgi:hypothetical protein
MKSFDELNSDRILEDFKMNELIFIGIKPKLPKCYGMLGF